MKYNLDRFLSAQEEDYALAYNEIKAGRKQSHWIWYIFPQLAGLGSSSTSIYYGIKNIEEAKEYLDHPILGVRLIEICKVLLTLKNTNANSIFGSPDDLKLKSCMTLFSIVDTSTDNIFLNVLNKYFQGKKDINTCVILGV
ncbi:MAG: DUF1810 domain-containing protein [Chitinophagales bacterium]|nr:DUF1810 domain-containing protein [Chitinophagales bacterium]